VSVHEDSIERIRSATFPIARKGYDKREVERFLTSLADWLEGGGADEALSDVIKRELERVGQKTGAILAAAHEAAEEIRLEAEEEAGRTIEDARREEMRIRALVEEYDSRGREEADRYAEETRQEADLYASRTRQDADRYSAEGIAEADGYSTRTRADADAYAEEVRAKAERDAEEQRAAVKHEAREIILAAEVKAKQAAEAGERRRRDMETVISDLSTRRDTVLQEIRRLTGELSSTVGSHASESQSDADSESEGSEEPRSEAERKEAPPSPPGDSQPGRQAAS
jgi:DivIVA domain-containing protein